MTNIIKKIIQEELDRFNGKLNVFDFDETLVSDSAMAYVIRPDGSRMPINHDDYKTFVPGPDDLIDITEFDQVNNPVINEPMVQMLKNSQKNSIILTARTEGPPIEKFLRTLGIDVPVFTVGSKDPKFINSSLNAKRKFEFLKKVIEKFNIKEIEFWDDNGLNLYEAQKLSNLYPVKIITHLVKFSPK